jgi:hypothetical protein
MMWIRSGANQKRMTLLADLEAFVHDHRPHGGMTGEATQPARNGYWTCPDFVDT